MQGFTGSRWKLRELSEMGIYSVGEFQGEWKHIEIDEFIFDEFEGKAQNQSAEINLPNTIESNLARNSEFFHGNCTKNIPIHYSVNSRVPL